jgi:hypothetical protein
MFCKPICQNSPWMPAEKTLVASTVILMVSAAALAIIFYAANPLSHPQYMALVYADASLGGLAILGLAIGAVFKCCKTGKSNPRPQKPGGLEHLVQGLQSSEDGAPTSILNSENSSLVFDERKLQETVLRDWDAIYSDEPPPRIIKHAGKHMRVIEHAEFPGLIIKLPSPQHAQGMYACLQRSQQVLKDHPHIKHCKVPATKVLPLNKDRSLFVMEKVEGIISSSHAQEVSEQAYEKFENDPNLEMKWRSFFNDAAEFICLAGYWDTSWNNIILLQNGFGFVDYEHLEPSPQNIITGISRLLEMAPPQFADTITQIASKYGISFSSQQLGGALRVPNLDAFKIARQQKLDLRSKVRKWQKGSKIKNPAEKISLERWHEASTERIIIDKFNESVADQQKYYKHNPIDQRKLSWQPFCFNKALKRDQLEAALQNLQKHGIVCDWTTEENPWDATLVGYDIYF